MAEPIAEAVVKITTDLTEVKAGLDKLKQQLDESKQGSDKFSSALSNLKDTMLAAFSVTAIVAFGKEAVNSFLDAEESAAKLAAVVDKVGERAGYTYDQMMMLSSALQGTTKFSDETIQGVESMLASFDKVKGDNFEQLTKSALDMATLMGGDAVGAARSLGMAMEYPDKAARALMAANIKLSDSQQEQIKNLVDEGKHREAQGIVLDLIKQKTEGLAEASGKTLGGQLVILKNTFGDAMEVIGQGIAKTIGPLIPVIKDATLEFTAFWGAIFGGKSKAQESADTMISFTSNIKQAQDNITKYAAEGNDNQVRMWTARLKQQLDAKRQFLLSHKTEKEKETKTFKDEEDKKPPLTKDALEKIKKANLEAAEKITADRLKYALIVSDQIIKDAQELTDALQKEEDDRLSYSLTVAQQIADEQISLAGDLSNALEMYASRDIDFQVLKLKEVTEAHIAAGADATAAWEQFYSSIGKINPVIQSQKSLSDKVVDIWKATWSRVKEIWNTISSIGSTVVNIVVSGFTALLNLPRNMMDAATGIRDMMANFPTMLFAFTNQLPILIQEIIAAIPKIIDALVLALPIIVDTIVKALPVIMDSIVKAIPIIIDAFIKALPPIIQAIIDAIPAIVDAVVNAIPKIISVIVDAIPLIIESMRKETPKIIRAFIAGIADIITAIIDNLPEIIVGMIESIPILIEAIIERIPQIIQAIIRMIPNLVVALINSVIEETKRVLTNITNYIGTLGGQIWEAVKDIPGKLWEEMKKLFDFGSLFNIGGGGGAGGGDWWNPASWFADGGIFNNGRVQAYATGGIVSSPTFFPMASGAGLMGEAGPEAVMPLQRNSKGQLGITSSDTGEKNLTVNVMMDGRVLASQLLTMSSNGTLRINERALVNTSIV